MSDTIVRSWSPAGPCLTLGKLTKTTAKFYCYDEWRGRNDKDEMVYRGAKKVKRPEAGYTRAHIVPCSSCRDHPNTSYPNGYMD